MALPTMAAWIIGAAAEAAGSETAPESDAALEHAL